MTDHPSTYKAFDTHSPGIDWDDHATVHRRDDGDGVLGGFKTIEHGTLAQMVALVSRLPEGERQRYAIEKAGDHRLDIAEIMALASRDDFPG